MNSRNELFDNSKQCIVERRHLKAKVRKLTNECIQNNCADYLKKMKKLNFFELNNEKSINNAIKLGINFHFNKNNYNSINRNLKRINNSLKEESIKLDNDFKFFCNTLKNDFSINELEAIKNDQLYYIPNSHIRSNLKLNKKSDLEKNEIDKTNILLINKTIYTKFCKREKNIDKKVFKNIIIVKNIIKKGINKLKNEEKKKIMKKEQIKKLLNEFHNQSKKEVYSLINDKSYKKLFNSIDEESFLREYNRKRYSQIEERSFLKNRNVRINKTQDNIILNKSYNKKVNIYPRISSHSLIDQRKNVIKNSIINNFENRKKLRIFSLRLSRNYLLKNYSKSVANSKEDLMKKRLEENIQKQKEEKEFHNKLLNKIRSNYKINNIRKLNFKYLI